MFGRFLLLLSLIATVAACANADVDAPGNEVPTAVARMTAPPTAAPTATFTPLPTNTNTPSPTATHPPTSTPTVSPTDTPAATPTPAAKLDPEAARAYIAERLKYDAACPLPCWWGATPGETRWAEVYPLLVSLDALSYAPDDPENGTYSIYLPHIPDDLISDPLGLELFYYVEEGIVDSVNLGVRSVPAYRLHSILIDYGPPSGVRVQSQPFTPPGEVIFRIALLYEEQGFAAQITTTNAWVSEDRVVACLTDEARQGTSLFMWVPGAFSGFHRIAQEWSIGQEPSTYVKIEAATGMDVQTFFDTHAGPDGERCITTPVEIWE